MTYYKVRYFEFWPYWVFYFPMLFYGIYLALKARSFLYFTATNPAMVAGGLVGEAKMNLLRRLAPEFLPETVLLDASTGITTEQIASLRFPCVVKPNCSERGFGVERIVDIEALRIYFKEKSGDFVVQEFVTYPLELGILYHRFPGGKSGITSVVSKEFLTLTGDGQSTVEQLMQANIRACFRWEYLQEKFKNSLSIVLPLGETMLLEPIGNHNRGTKFLNANYLINEQLLAVFDRIAAPLNGFYYGRFDIKVASLDDLYAGKEIRVLEVNGVESEPAHIYDPAMSLWEAYHSVLTHMQLIYRISKANRKAGARVDSFVTFIRTMRAHFVQRKLYTAA